jgi:ATP-independent RNA helicase DbpA
MTRTEKVLQHLNITSLTPIQTQVIEKWTDNQDVLGLSPTGSGKTLAFTLPTLNKLDIEQFYTQFLVLCPTRELATQVAEQIRKACQILPNIHVVCLIGGDAMGPQIQALKGACHIVVGTPGRVREHCEKRRLNLSKVHTRVLDEADRMLEMGMVDDVEVILSGTPKQCRSGFFSATFADDLDDLCNRWLHCAVRVDVRGLHTVAPNISQHIYCSEKKQKAHALFALLTEEQAEKTIIFVQTKKDTQHLFEQLREKGFSAITLHGDLEQYQRERSLAKFKMGAANVLVATDVAARGLDLPMVDVVISFDLSENADTHKHRIGRTGRAGASGKAIMLVSDNEVEIAKSRLAETDSQKVLGVQHLRFHSNRMVSAQFQTLEIRGGKKDKLRKGDVVGALIKEAGIPGEDVGDIVLNAKNTFIAIKLRSVKRALTQFREGKIKGRKYQAMKF